MNMFDFQEGRQYAIQMIEAASSAPKNKGDMETVIHNLEESAKKRPASYAAGIESVLSLVRGGV